ELTGTKLRGAFTLVRTKAGGGAHWLLFKRSDAHAAARDVTALDRSALSGRRLADVAAPPKPSRARGKIAVPGAPAGPFPRGVRPMLATLADGPFDRPGWVFEVKWDGYRAVAEVEGGDVRLTSRTGK